MEENSNVLIKVLLFMFIAFLIMYVSKEAGYYEYKAYTKSKLTEESIKKFESDIESGKDVSLKDYVVDDYVDYSNFVTKAGSNIGNNIEKFMNEGIKNTLKFLGALFYEKQG